MLCVATFYSHFGAIHFKRYCGTRGWEAKLMPVPRQLSSSCGTCVRFLVSETVSCGDAAGDRMAEKSAAREIADENAALSESACDWLSFSDFPEMEQLAVPEGEGYRTLWHADSNSRV